MLRGTFSISSHSSSTPLCHLNGTEETWMYAGNNICIRWYLMMMMMMDKLNCHSKNVSRIDVRNLCVYELILALQKAILIDDFHQISFYFYQIEAMRSHSYTYSVWRNFLSAILNILDIIWRCWLWWWGAAKKKLVSIDYLLNDEMYVKWIFFPPIAHPTQFNSLKCTKQFSLVG